MDELEAKMRSRRLVLAIIIMIVSVIVLSWLLKQRDALRQEDIESRLSFYITEYNTDYEIWQSLRHLDSVEATKDAINAKVRANKTAKLYNECLQKNRHFFTNGLPEGLVERLPYLTE